jgi:hypothetical protein
MIETLYDHATLNHGTQLGEDDYEAAVTIPSHPLRVKPAGNAYAAHQSTSSPFLRLPHELVVEILDHLDFQSLVNLGGTCKTFFAFSRFEDFWKAFCIRYVLITFCYELH